MTVHACAAGHPRHRTAVQINAIPPDLESSASKRCYARAAEISTKRNPPRAPATNTPLEPSRTDEYAPQDRVSDLPWNRLK